MHEIDKQHAIRYHGLLECLDDGCIDDGVRSVFGHLRTSCFLEAAVAQQRSAGKMPGSPTAIEAAACSHRLELRRSVLKQALQDELPTPTDLVSFEVPTREQLLARLPALSTPAPPEPLPMQATAPQAITKTAPRPSQPKQARPAIVRGGPAAPRAAAAAPTPRAAEPTDEVQVLSVVPAPSPAYVPSSRPPHAPPQASPAPGRRTVGPPSSSGSGEPKRPVFSTASEFRGKAEHSRKRPLDAAQQQQHDGGTWDGGAGRQGGARGWQPPDSATSRGPPPSYRGYQQQQQPPPPAATPQESAWRPRAGRVGGGGEGFLSSRLMGPGDDDHRMGGAEGEGAAIPAPGATSAVRKPFVPPTRTDQPQQQHHQQRGGAAAGRGIGGAPGTTRAMVNRALVGPANGQASSSNAGRGGEEEEVPEKLKGCDPVLVERIENDIIDRGDPITFDDIAGLAFAKKCVMELVCWPMARPDIFTGLRSLPKGLLLFGPPGTGKTLIGKAIAHQSGATFFNISASSLTSKWIGEGERLVRTLFAVASHHQPAIIFIDEVDSLLCQRSAEENESSRRLKTEFLVQLDGAGTSSEDRVLVVGATNRPQELDEAARRRFVKRLYIPLPEAEARQALVTLLLSKNPHSLSTDEVHEVVVRTAGFSGADLRALCTEAAMGPIRDMATDISRVRVSDVPPIRYQHFLDALASIRPSVSEKDLGGLKQWNQEFGTFPRLSEEDHA